MPKDPHNDSLDEYRKKRDPNRTGEPFGPAPRGNRGPTRQGDFVVHLHDARRRHYDLRVEVGGTLKSFAVPKGPSLRPGDKRLAVETEPHPLDYLGFEEVIPEGNYGAGAMIAWDRGRIHYLDATAEEGYGRGKIDFRLEGHKLKGRYALVRTTGRRGETKTAAKNQWLLFKKKDPYANPERDITRDQPESVLSGLTVEELAKADQLGAALVEEAARLGAPPGAVDVRRARPMLCTSHGGTLETPGFLYELKLDGVRILASRDGEHVAMFYRTGRPATATYPEIAEALRRRVPPRFVVDGEIIALDAEGKPNFDLLLRRIAAPRPLDVRYAARSVPVVYVVFDVLEMGGRDVRALPLVTRKHLVSRFARGRGLVRALDHVENDGTTLYEFATAHDLEGIVAKRADSLYQCGIRSGNWIKIKREREDDFVVYGVRPGEGARRRLGALLLGSYEDERLVARGRVGTGLSDEAIERLLSRLEPERTDACPAEGAVDPPALGQYFVHPEVVVRVRYGGFSDEGRLRFPVFVGERHDVEPSSCRTAPRRADDAVLAVTPKRTVRGADTRTAGTRGVVLTNQSKVFWPDDGTTKGDVCAYYETMAEAILPYLRDRPVVLVRYPDGVAGKSFYQWRLPTDAPLWVRSLLLRTEEERTDGRRKGTRREVETFLVDDADTLLYVANLGAIPIHVLAARAESLDRCDFLSIDFDLGEGELRKAISLARALRELLLEIGLEGFPKTSGQRGIHVLVPLGPEVPFESAKMLGELLGRLLVTRHPEMGTMERIKEKRGTLVYVDTGQIGRSRTIVAPWSVRAYPGATVSTPLHWDEVGHALDPRRFTIRTVPERMARVGDPMLDMLGASPDVSRAVELLGEKVSSLK